MADPLVHHRHTDVGAKQLGSWKDFFVGIACEVSMAATLGQPLEVTKTHIADAGRPMSLRQASWEVVQRRGLYGLYSGLLPWAVLESVSGGVLVYTAHQAHDYTRQHLLAGSQLPQHTQYIASHAVAGMAGGACQGTVMVPLIRLKTAEMTRSSTERGPVAFMLNMVRTQGVTALWRGGTMVVARQITNWGTRMGVARWAEERTCRMRQQGCGGSGCHVHVADRVGASLLGGVVSCWNHPIDVAMTRMQSTAPGAPSTVSSAFRVVYQTAGVAGFARGLKARVLLSAYATLCMVAGSDLLRGWVM